MSHLFHGLLINLIRRSDCQTVQPVGPNEADNDDLEVAWLRWAEAEGKKRYRPSQRTSIFVVTHC
jgi:hypothetical protein